MLATSASISFVSVLTSDLRPAFHQLKPRTPANTAERTTTGSIRVLAMLASRSHTPKDAVILHMYFQVIFIPLSTGLTMMERSCILAAAIGSKYVGDVEQYACSEQTHKPSFVLVVLQYTIMFKYDYYCFNRFKTPSASAYFTNTFCTLLLNQ